MTAAKTVVKQRAKGAKRTAKVVSRKTKKAAGNPWLERATRLGYLFRALLYGIVGFLAFRAALNQAGETEDLRGSLVFLPGGPVRPVLLIALIVGLFAYGLWGFVRAIYDPLNRGSDVAGMASRIGFVWSGLNYMLLVVFAITFLVGASNGDGSSSMYKIVSSVMAHNGGWIVLTIAGAVGTLSGLGQFVDAYKAGFRHDLKRNQMSKAQRTSVDSLGRIGMVARGVVFSLLGWFIFQAGLHHDPHRTENMRGVFATLGNLPFGHVVLATVSLGFIALAAHSLACARWIRIPDPQV